MIKVKRSQIYMENLRQSKARVANPMEEMTTAAAAACEITRLPEDLLSAVISHTAPRDACRAAAVSPAFRAAADSDAVWACFLPRHLPPLADGELGLHGPKKALFMRLSAGPHLLADRVMSMWLDRETGAKCFMLPAKALEIEFGQFPPTKEKWGWINKFRSSRGARVVNGRWLEICGKIHSKMLTQNSTYAAYMVFDIYDETCGLNSPDTDQTASVSIGERRTTVPVCLGPGLVDRDAAVLARRGAVAGYFHAAGSAPYVRPYRAARFRRVLLPGSKERRPQKRADNWMELELGEFYNEEGDDGEVSISLMEKRGHWKIGLIVQGIEIRPKK